MFKLIAAAVAAITLSAGTLSAATVTGNFGVTAVNVVGLDADDSKATASNFDAARAAANAGTAGYSIGSFNFDGALDFGTFDPTDATTISDWLASSVGGVVTGLDATFGGLQLSKPNIKKGTATTTFFRFIDNLNGFENGDLTITHDDGVLAFDAFGTDVYAGFEGPNGVRTTTGFFDGSFLDILYVATNGDPSVLKVDVSAVPLPAGLPLLMLGLGSIAALRRRNQAA